MTLLGFVAVGWIQDDHLQAGDYRRLVNSIDYKGQVCGTNDVSHKPYGYYLLDGSGILLYFIFFLSILLTFQLFPVVSGVCGQLPEGGKLRGVHLSL